MPTQKAIEAARKILCEVADTDFSIEAEVEKAANIIDQVINKVIKEYENDKPMDSLNSIR